MIEARHRPIRYCVTACAVRAETAAVNVIGGMAGVTGCVALRGEICGSVAGIAGQTVVAAAETEAREPKMIESERRPVTGSVAVPAVLTVAALMNILVSMTVNTPRGGVRKHRAAVATFTGCLGVRTGQQKTRQVMLKIRSCPLAFGVTITARSPQLLPVRILLTMTGYTLRCGCRIHRTGLMTGLAFGIGMSPGEWKVGERMIENVGVKINDSRIAAFMIGMT
jgi:hypothetical protein